MRIACFQIREGDNVATLLSDVPEGESVLVRSGQDDDHLIATEAIQAGHKVALREIAVGESILKYGFAIGEAIRPIRAGEWVHLHNCRSRFDEGSSTLDLQTGVRTETKYV